MEVSGYKAFNKDRTNRYSVQFEEGKSYHIDGNISFGNHGNGFHICKHLSDVFRFYDFYNCDVAEVVLSGDVVEYSMEDWYLPYDDMYVGSDLKIVRFLTKNEVLNRILLSSEQMC